MTNWINWKEKKPEKNKLIFVKQKWDRFTYNNTTEKYDLNENASNIYWYDVAELMADGLMFIGTNLPANPGKYKELFWQYVDLPML